MIRAAGRVEEKVLFWFLNALENGDAAVNLRIANDDMLRENISDERRGERV
jgi:hypothetical protein